MASFDPAATLDDLVRQHFRDMKVFWLLRDRKMLYLFYTIISLFNLIAECAVFIGVGKNIDSSMHCNIFL